MHICNILCDEDDVLKYDLEEAKNNKMLLEDVIILLENLIQKDLEKEKNNNDEIAVIEGELTDITKKLTIENERKNLIVSLEENEQKLKNTLLELAAAEEEVKVKQSKKPEIEQNITKIANTCVLTQVKL